MKRILIIGTSLREQALLEEIEDRNRGAGGFVFQTTGSFGQEATWWAQARIDCLVILLPEDEVLQAYYFIKLRKDVPKNLPLILITPVISQSLLQLTPIFSKVRILKAPVEGALLHRSVTDITTEWQPGRRQVHPRYMTDQVIQLGHVGTDQRIAATMRNLSVGGAYFEVQDDTINLKPTDIIRMEIELPGTSRYEFEARVVWSKDVNEKGLKGFGCTFTDMDEVYQSLLKGF